MTKRFHGLKKIKIRQSWNKHNLYNLSRLQADRTTFKTFFQQKWSAKAATRAYHGEHIREGQWERMFSPRLNSVVPMDHRYLASCDGSEQAEGRGSGKDMDMKFGAVQRSVLPTPYMHMTYAPTERRLDTAIFRALFASSARQARQFVVHGAVKVNGRKMIYPGYLLNPGDMFQVDPERVLFATGEPKNKDIEQVRMGRRLKRVNRNLNKQKEESRIHRKQKAANKAAEPDLKASEKPAPIRVMPQLTAEEKEAAEAEKRASLKAVFEGLVVESRRLQLNKDAPTARRKKEIREFQQKVRFALNKVKRKSISELESEMEGLMAQLTIVSREKGVSADDAANLVGEQDSEGRDRSEREEQAAVRTEPGSITENDRAALREMLRDARENPLDINKPYATPWRPRPYMSAFAFIPRYLEVNQNVCSAVYLRHPVARPGLAEVPTPFPYETSQLAFTYYLRRR